MLARLGETWVITRANNRAAIERELRAGKIIQPPNFVYVDLPSKVLRWKRGQRGIRLYYLLWQAAALREARRLERERPFDLAWHLTLANAWIGSTVSRLKAPFVYGPVGGGVTPPWRLARALGIRGVLYELTRAWARTLARYLNPLARFSWRSAALILVQNEETKQWLPHRYRHKTAIFPNVVLEDFPGSAQSSARRVMLFAGRLMPLKGVALALTALKALPGWRLLICGDGPDASRLRRLSARNGVQGRVEFRGWIGRSEVLQTMREEASVFVFPSLHDEAGWVVVEAMACALRVVCFDRGGPPLLAGSAGVVASADGAPAQVARALAVAVREAASRREAGVLDRAREFAMGERLEKLRRELKQAGLLDAAGCEAVGRRPRIAGPTTKPPD
jgi:glycosyltransferase involved in cell wall biosynthesis